MEALKDNMQEIIRICLKLDIMARDVYSNYSSLPLPAPLKKIIEILVRDETGHIAYWERLLKLSRQWAMLELFEDSDILLQELTVMAKTAQAMFKESLKAGWKGVADLLLHLIRMEYVLLHPSFIVLFKFIDPMPDGRSMEEEYEEHIEHICAALATAAGENPMFSLFGDLLRRTWHDTRRLVSLNQTDELTGVLNRRGFYEQIRPLGYLALRKKYCIAVMMIDVDHFKKINDKYGHQAGDSALRLVAEYVTANVRKSDVVARYGGDEFIIFFSDVDKESLLGVVEKIKNGLEDKSKNRLPLTVSMGIALKVICDEPSVAIEELVKAADEALYEVKQAGRNSFCIRNFL